MDRYLKGVTPPDASGREAGAFPTALTVRSLDPKILARLGLADFGSLPSDPRLLAEKLRTDDAADAAIDAEEFTRGIRRAIRLGVAYEARLHRLSGQRWTEWVSAQFQAGYSCYQRYHLAAELQIGLLSRNLPPLANEHQARAMAPLRKHAQFWEAVAANFAGGFPPGHELRQRLQSALGLTAKPASSTPRIKLHRILTRVVQATPPGDDPAVAHALALVRQAIATLEKGLAP